MYVIERSEKINHYWCVVAVALIIGAVFLFFTG